MIRLIITTGGMEGAVVSVHLLNGAAVYVVMILLIKIYLSLS